MEIKAVSLPVFPDSLEGCRFVVFPPPQVEMVGEGVDALIFLLSAGQGSPAVTSAAPSDQFSSLGADSDRSGRTVTGEEVFTGRGRGLNSEDARFKTKTGLLTVSFTVSGSRLQLP